MNYQLIAPVALIIVIGLVLAIIFLNKKDKKEWEEQLNEDGPKKRLSDTDEGENQKI